MASLNPIVKIINAALIANVFSDKRFQKVAAFGITKALPYGKPGEYHYLPTELNDSGEGKEVVPDDKNPVQLYHKINSISYTSAKGQFGNGNNLITRTSSMSMIVFAQRNIIKLSEDALDVNIQAGIPSSLSQAELIKLKLNGCAIATTGTDFNSVALWSREFTTKKYYLKPEHLFFEVKYSIECIVKKKLH